MDQNYKENRQGVYAYGEEINEWEGLMMYDRESVSWKVMFERTAEMIRFWPFRLIEHPPYCFYQQRVGSAEIGKAWHSPNPHAEH